MAPENSDKQVLEAIFNCFETIKCSKEDNLDDKVRQFVDLFSKLEYMKDVSYRNLTGDGHFFKDRILAELFSPGVWNDLNMVNLFAVIKEVQIGFSSEENQKLIDAIFEELNTADAISEKTSVMIQNMLSLFKEFKLRLEVFRKTVKYFGDMNKAVEDRETDQKRHRYNLRKLEALVIHHILYECSGWSVELLRDLLKSFKQYSSLPELVLTPFSVGLSLALCERYQKQENVIISVKKVLTRCFEEDTMRRHGSDWYCSLVPEKGVKIFKLPEALAQICKQGIDISKPIMDLSFRLIDTLPNFSKSALNLFDRPLKTLTVHETLNVFGSMMVLALFDAVQKARESLIAELFDRVAEKSYGSFFTNVAVLGKILRKSPQSMLDCKSEIVKIMEWIPHCTHLAAVEILKALLPLMRVSGRLKDSLVTIFRNSMFHKDVEVQKVAISGYLVALKFFKLSGSMPWSQSQSQSVFSILNPSQLRVSQRFDLKASEALCVDLFRILRRSLSQASFPVRQTFYDGIPSVVKTNPKLIGMVSQLLAEQFEKVFTKKCEGMTLIILKNCVSKPESEEPVLMEPFAHLAKAADTVLYYESIHVTTSTQREEFENVKFADSVTKLKSLLTNLVTVVVSARLGELGFDHTVNLRDKNMLKWKMALQMIALLEVCIEHYYMNSTEENDCCHNILLLYTKAKKLSELIGRNKKPAKSSNKRPKKDPKAKEKADQSTSTSPSSDTASSLAPGAEDVATQEYDIDENELGDPSSQVPCSQVLPNSAPKDFERLYVKCMLSMAFFRRFFNDYAICAKDGGEDVPTKDMVNSLEIVHYLMESLLNRISYYNKFERFDSFTGESIDKLFPVFCDISRPLFNKVLFTQIQTQQQTTQQSLFGSQAVVNEATILRDAIAVLKQLFLVLHKRFPDHMLPFLKSIAGETDPRREDENEDQDDRTEMSEEEKDKTLKHVISKIEELIEGASKVSQNSFAVNEYLSILEILVNPYYLTNESTIVETHEWIQSICLSREVSDSNAAKAFLSLCIDLGFRRKKVMQKLLKPLAMDIHKCLGDINESFTVEHEKKFSIVVGKAVAPACVLLLDKTVVLLKEIDCVFSKMKTMTDLRASITYEDRERDERIICKRLNHLLDMAVELTHTSLPDEKTLVGTYTLLIKFYDMLTNITKFFCNLFVAKLSYGLPDLYIELIKRCGKLMSNKLTDFVTYADKSPVKVSGQGKRKVNSTKETKRIREMKKHVSNVIFSYETFLRFLAMLQTKSKMELTKYFTESHGIGLRHFKLDGEKLAELRAQVEEGKELDQGEGGDSD